jgi:hypothetical protein
MFQTFADELWNIYNNQIILQYMDIIKPALYTAGGLIAKHKEDVSSFIDNQVYNRRRIS